MYIYVEAKNLVDPANLASGNNGNVRKGVRRFRQKVSEAAHSVLVLLHN